MVLSSVSLPVTTEFPGKHPPASSVCTLHPHKGTVSQSVSACKSMPWLVCPTLPGVPHAARCPPTAKALAGPPRYTQEG